MKKFMLLSLISLLLFSSCSLKNIVSEEFVVVEVTETYLLVAKRGENEEILEEHYSLPNYFNPSVKIEIGDKIKVIHNGISLETFPAQFSKIYEVEFFDKEAGKVITISPDHFLSSSSEKK